MIIFCCSIGSVNSGPSSHLLPHFDISQLKVDGLERVEDSVSPPILIPNGFYFGNEMVSSAYVSFEVGNIKWGIYSTTNSIIESMCYNIMFRCAC